MTVDTQQTPQGSLELTITYYLSPLGRKRALAAGIIPLEQQRVTGYITAEQLDKLEPVGFGITDDGRVKVGNLNGHAKLQYSDRLKKAEAQIVEEHGTVQFEQLFYDEPQTFGALLADYARIEAVQREVSKRVEAAQKARRERERAELHAKQSAAVDAFLADPHARAQRESWKITLGDVVIEHRDPRYEEVDDVALRRINLDEDRKKAAEEAIKQAKADQIAVWVSEKGTLNQRERLQVGLLPRSEVLELMKEETFAPLESWATYEAITPEDVRKGCDDQCECGVGYGYGDDCEVICEAGEAAEASEGEWEQIKAMRCFLPEAAFTLRAHKCYCDGEGCNKTKGSTVTRRGIYVKIVVGAFTFVREYAIENA